MNTWNLQEAIKVCIEMERIAPQYGCHVALTGGCLYKQGERKDLDILLYRIRQVKEINYIGLFNALKSIGIEIVSGFGWVYKAKMGERNIDLFFPEEKQGVYFNGR